MPIPASSNEPDTVPSLHVLQSELDAYRRTGCAVHLAQAARALNDARIELQSLQTPSRGSVGKNTEEEVAE